MKTILTILIAFLLISEKSYGQEVLIDKNGVAHFFSEAPLEDIEAVNKKAIGAIDMGKGTVAVSMLIKNFHFDKSLMEEHFNENYMESEKFPKASFKGSISDFSNLDFNTPGSFSAVAEGEIAIHGVTKPMMGDVAFKVTNDSVIAKTTFKVALKDHKVKIPKLVIKNIAEVVDVDVTFNFEKNSN